ncbi:MAG TPA: hypothetical protein VMJ75_01350 [Candidatus Acidoferrales bacterium]|nr:hypothetical protein [Candidatus Acidoferrales bacterium]
MDAKLRKTLEDFPKFSVSQLTRVGTDSQGFTRFELNGEFDRLVQPQGQITWFWLLIGDRAAVCAQWKSVGPGNVATVTADEKEMPEIVGKTLYYLSPAWDARHIWMVLDEQWGWKRVLFQAVDAVAEAFEATDISIVDGREVKTWTKLSRADKCKSTKRYAPTLDDTLVSGRPAQLVPGGWDHEHCQLCREHINNGDFGYRDEDDHWLCESCYDKYVKHHDLSFVDDL